MELNQQIEEIVKKHFADERFFIVLVKSTISKIRSKITILVDTDEGITIDELGTLSREIEGDLDTLIPSAFTLEVSSPGIDFPLSSERQFRKNIGRDVSLLLADGSISEGKLSEVSAYGMTILPKTKKKKEEVLPQKFEFSQIKQAKVVVSFK